MPRKQTFLRAATGPGLNPHNIMAVLQAYFDESGKLHGDAEHVVFGGLAGRMDEISAFHRRWNEILGSDLDHIHMRDAMRLENAFKGWNETRRDEVLTECARLAQTASAMLIVSEMDKKDFVALSPAEKKRLKTPTYGGFEACVRALALEFKSDDIHIWYDESEEYARTCLQMYQRMKALNADLSHRLQSLTFANDEKFPGLQAADMVAYCAFVVRRDGPAARRIVRELDSTLRKNRGTRTHMLYVKGASLGEGMMEPRSPIRK